MPKGIPPVTVVVGKTYVMAMVIVMIPHIGMNSLLCLYL